MVYFFHHYELPNIINQHRMARAAAHRNATPAQASPSNASQPENNAANSERVHESPARAQQSVNAEEERQPTEAAESLTADSQLNVAESAADSVEEETSSKNTSCETEPESEFSVHKTGLEVERDLVKHHGEEEEADHKAAALSSGAAAPAAVVAGFATVDSNPANDQESCSEALRRRFAAPENIEDTHDSKETQSSSETVLPNDDSDSNNLS